MSISFTNWWHAMPCGVAALLLSAGIPRLAGAPQQLPVAPASKPAASAVSALPSQTSEQALQDALKQQRASLERQRQAIQKQFAEKAGAADNTVSRFIDPLPALSQADCPTLDGDTVNELVSAAAQKQSLDPALLRAVMKQESGFKPCAVSVKGARGLMQLMPGTARELHVADVFNPSQNVQGGAAYLKQLLARYKGDLRLALVGYNAGPGRADQSSGTPYPLETQDYVASIFADLGMNLSGSPAAQEEVTPPEEDDESAPVASDAIKPIDAAVPAIAPATEPTIKPKDF
jgi:soluble lytic murein transglycosylase-like protein